MVSHKKMSKLIMDCYRELYNNADPPLDFDTVLKDPKDFDFNNYKMSKSTFEQIVDKYRSKLTSKYDLNVFSFNIYLGPSPTIIY